jgi:hypothetical protein
MSTKELLTCLGVTIAVTLFLFPWYSNISLWIGVSITIATLAIINTHYASTYMIPYPQLAILIAYIQHVLAAWGNSYIPYYNPTVGLNMTYNMVLNEFPRYLSYAGPACLLFAAGLLLPTVVKVTQPAMPGAFYGNDTNRESLARELNVLFVMGVVATLLMKVAPTSLKFVTVLLHNLAYVGAFGYLILAIPGWKLRLIIIYALLGMRALMGGSFHDLITWTAFLVLFISYSKRWSKRRIFVFIVAGAISVVLILSVKEEYRQQLWYGRTPIAENRVVAFSSLLLNAASNPARLLSRDNMSAIFVRLNQGWIVSRAMMWTPEMESFAKGKTIVNSFFGALVPRFLNPNKGEVGGRQDYKRYTGLELWGSTSMELGYAGEMYINFGPKWGLVAIGIYGLILGLGFRWLYLRAVQQPLWWIWVPYLAFVAIKAETSIGYIANWLFKALIVMIGVIWFCPAMKQVLMKTVWSKEHAGRRT